MYDFVYKIRSRRFHALFWRSRTLYLQLKMLWRHWKEIRRNYSPLVPRTNTHISLDMILRSDDHCTICGELIRVSDFKNLRYASQISGQRKFAHGKCWKERYPDGFNEYVDEIPMTDEEAELLAIQKRRRLGIRHITYMS